MVSEKQKLIAIAGDSSDIAHSFSRLVEQSGHQTFGFGRSSKFRVIDVTRPEELSRLMLQIKNEGLKFDGFLNLIGGHSGSGKTTELSLGDVQKTFAMNVFTAFELAREFAPYMKGDSTWLNISSQLTQHPSVFNSHYSSSKAALESMTKSLAMEWEQKKVRVLCLRLGGIATSKKLSDPFLKKDKKLATTEEAAKFIQKIFNDGSYLTGGIIDFGP